MSTRSYLHRHLLAMHPREAGAAIALLAPASSSKLRTSDPDGHSDISEEMSDESRAARGRRRAHDDVSKPRGRPAPAAAPHDVRQQRRSAPSTPVRSGPISQRPQAGQRSRSRNEDGELSVQRPAARSGNGAWLALHSVVAATGAPPRLASAHHEADVGDDSRDDDRLADSGSCPTAPALRDARSTVQGRWAEARGFVHTQPIVASSAGPVLPAYMPHAGMMFGVPMHMPVQMPMPMTMPMPVAGTANGRLALVAQAASSELHRDLAARTASPAPTRTPTPVSDAGPPAADQAKSFQLHESSKQAETQHLSRPTALTERRTDAPQASTSSSEPASDGKPLQSPAVVPPGMQLYATMPQQMMVFAHNGMVLGMAPLGMGMGMGMNPMGMGMPMMPMGMGPMSFMMPMGMGMGMMAPVGMSGASPATQPAAAALASISNTTGSTLSNASAASYLSTQDVGHPAAVEPIEQASISNL